MDKVDFIIDNSENPEQMLNILSGIAREHHGSDAFHKAIDTAQSPDEADEKIIKMARDAVNARKPTKEDQPLVDVPGLRDLTTLQQWYGGLDNLSYLAKPLAFMTTPLTEGARALPKYIAEHVGNNTSQTPPIDTGAEYNSFHPSDKAGLSLLLRDLVNAVGVQTHPTVDIESKDYPKLAEFGRQMTDPTNLGGAGLDIMAGAKIPQVPVVSGLASITEDANSFANKARRIINPSAKEYSPATQYKMSDVTGLPIQPRIEDINTPALRESVLTNRHPTINLDTAKNYLRSIAKDSGLLLELEKTGKINDLARMVMQQPEKYLRQFNPKAIWNEIQGEAGFNGELSRQMDHQDRFLDNLPENGYAVPAEELQKNALNELNNQQLLESQKRGATSIIQEEIPVMQPDPAKIDKINTARDARRTINKNTRHIKYDTEQLKSQLRLKKNEIMERVRLEPDYVHNPKFRADLQWIKDAEIQINGQDVFPKETVSNTTTITTPNDPYRMESYQGKSNLGGPDIVSETTTSQSFNPAMNPVDKVIEDAISRFQTQGEHRSPLLDVAEGKHLEPQQIPNESKLIMRDQAMKKMVEINEEIKNLKSQKSQYVDNSRLIQLEAEKQMAEKVFAENFDPTMPIPEAYINYIRQANEKPAGWVSKIRRNGNKLMERPVPGEISFDIANRNAAGRAMERVARNAQDQIMGTMDPADVIQYRAKNNQISNLIDLRNLTEKNLISSGPTADVYLPGAPTGRSGAVGAIAKGMDRYVKPTMSEIGSAGLNSTNNLGTRTGIMGASAVTSANEFVHSKSAVNEFKIPRSTVEIMQSKPMVLKKIEREFGPEMAKQFDTANQEQMAYMINNMSKMNPNAFGTSPYNSVDGMIYDPIMKQKALEDIVKTPGPAYHKAKQAEELINSNRLLQE